MDVLARRGTGAVATGKSSSSTTVAETFPFKRKAGRVMCERMAIA